MLEGRVYKQEWWGRFMILPTRTHAHHAETHFLAAGTSLLKLLRSIIINKMILLSTSG